MNCGKCQSPLMYGVPACTVCGTPVAWDQVSPPQPVQQPVPQSTAIPQAQPTVITPAQTVARTDAQTIMPSPSVVTPQPLQLVAQPTDMSAQSFQPPTVQQPTQQPAFTGQPTAQFMQSPTQFAGQNQPLDQPVKSPRATASAIAAIVLGAVQLLISLAAFTDEEVAATSGAGVINAAIGIVFIVVGSMLLKVSNLALLLKLSIGFAILSLIIVVLSFTTGVAGYHYVIAIGFAGFSIWKLIRAAKHSS